MQKAGAKAGLEFVLIYQLFGHALVIFLAPLLLGAITACVLWALRRFAPRAEWWFFSPLSLVIRRLVARALRGRLVVLPRETARPRRASQR